MIPLLLLSLCNAVACYDCIQKKYRILAVLNGTGAVVGIVTAIYLMM